MRVTLALLTLNEIEGMKAIMPRIKKEWYDELIIADGGSTDGTLEYARENGYDVFIQQGEGFGGAFAEAVAKATGDIVILLSPDGNSLPEKIPELVGKMKEGYDIVICSRYLGGARSHDDNLVTAFGNWLFTNLDNLLFGGKYSDWLVMYRAYRKGIFKELGVDIKSPSFGTEVLARATREGLKVGEIPGDEGRRIGGVSKMRPIKCGLVELRAVLREFFKGITK